MDPADEKKVRIRPSALSQWVFLALLTTGGYLFAYPHLLTQKVSEPLVWYPVYHSNLLPLHLPSESLERSASPDFAGLEMKTPVKRRVIHKNWEKNYNRERQELLGWMEEQSKDVSDKYLESFHFTGKRDCYRVAWRDPWFPTCNTVHEMRLVTEEETVTYRGSGYYRDSWVWDDQVVAKRFRYKHDVQTKYMAQVKKEALVMERLTKSPRIVDIYGHCGLTILAEYMEGEVTREMIPLDGKAYMSQKEIDEQHPDAFHSFNNLTNNEKLNLAIAMAESIADIHGYGGGVIAHGDIHPVQFLRKGDQVKLNDFNNGEILEYNPWKQEYCPQDRCYSGTFRSPEELACVDCTEQMDTYSMGNNIYVLLTGLWPFYQVGNRRKTQGEIADRKVQAKPYVDARLRNRSSIESGLIAVMEQLWEYDPNRRISIFEAVRQLREIRERHAS